MKGRDTKCVTSLIGSPKQLLEEKKTKYNILPQVFNVGRNVILGAGIKIIFRSCDWSFQTLQIFSQLPPENNKIKVLIQFRDDDIFYGFLSPTKVCS